MHGSLSLLLKAAMNGKHVVLDSIKVLASESTIESVIFGMIEEQVEDIFTDDANILSFSQNIIAACIKSMVCSSLYFLGTEMFEK